MKLMSAYELEVQMLQNTIDETIQNDPKPKSGRWEIDVSEISSAAVGLVLKGLRPGLGLHVSFERAPYDPLTMVLKFYPLHTIVCT